MSEHSFDVLVIGGGPGGYTAAIRAAQLGMRVACVDSWPGDSGKPALGGTCTNVGCIPSKALLQSSEYFEIASSHFEDHGVRLKELAFDIAQAQRRKEGVVRKNNEGISYLFRKNKVTFFHGHAAFTGRDSAGVHVAISGTSPALDVTAENVIIATGSRPRPFPDVPFDERLILSNDGALRLPTVPKRLGVIGAGVIGVELGSVWRRLGADVTLLEAQPVFLPMADEEVAAEALKVLGKQGLRFEFSVQIDSVNARRDDVVVQYTSQSQSRELVCDHLIVSIGRIPNTDGLAGESIGLALDGRGAIEVDSECRTTVDKVWAIGDVVRGPMLAHKAEAEGVAAVERIAGQKPEVDFKTIPSVIYTHPEVAWVGWTEAELRASGLTYRAGIFPLLANGRARALGDITGFVKVLADARTDRVLGVHVIGPHASELITEGTMAMEFRGTAEDIAAVTHPHPTLAEAVKEAALASNGRAINF
ncbi:dihydrolipoyl dehydrogenase [Caenimonas soli]|uniref:dihydrolipoyl dehydrogenase n=1 Tax=Caenimonas soli TaxID=2735555 RepID=UPI0015542B9A|nr:dihydrolipoyl dehydrogenase [Caenimonas soli]NPC58509.1 dihydrolipoyl dehydrogenase [Caenimonas soli]